MKRKAKGGKTLLLIIVLAAVVIAVALLAVPRKPADEATAAVFEARRQDMKITIVENGSIVALKKLEIKSEVEGQTAVLSLIAEGTFLTEADVEEGRVLVELDSSEIREKISQQEITLQSSESSYKQAKETYNIQVNQNDSNIKAGELNVKFSRMDFDKYLGEELAVELIDHASSQIDFGALLADGRLGGEALQSKRKFLSDISIAKEEKGLADAKYDGTEKLYEKKFVSANELEADRLAMRRKDVAVQQAETAENIFIRYEFPKMVEQRLADYHEACKELERINARAAAELAKADAELKNKEFSYIMQKERYEKLQEQLKACVIHATQPGLVVYATSGNPWHREPPLEEGSNVRERQGLINIPDTTQMAAEIKVHEASIDSVKVGQAAKITFEAYPELVLTARVHKKAMLPDPQHRWMNPDLQVYNTQVIIDGQHRLLKPGLSAKVEILIDSLSDVLVVPIQCVVPEGDQSMCYVLTDGRQEKRPVQAGKSNDELIQIVSGLEAGAKVILNPPRYGSSAGSQAEQPEEQDDVEAESQDAGEKQDDPPAPEDEPQQGQEIEQKPENNSPEEPTTPPQRSGGRSRTRRPAPQE